MDPAYTPLFDTLVNHAKSKSRSFHVPGHKNGALFPEKARPYYDELLALDLTELPGLDDLHQPTGVIAEAEELLADFYDSDRSYFLVGGSTVGNLAMVLSVCTRGDTILIQRNSHQSLYHAIALAGARAVFIAPEMDEASGLATLPAPATVEMALESYPKAKALVLTYPNYYGMAADIAPLIRNAHKYDTTVLVDEAHGAHFTLGSPFPPSALDCGADGVVQSAHKTLPAMTMGAYLHTRGQRVDSACLEEKLRMLQSSSPSYPIMASLDLARRYLVELDSAKVNTIVDDIYAFREELERIPQLAVLAPPSDAYGMIDPLKVTVQTRCELAGTEISFRLQQQGIDTELADPDHVLFVLPLARFDERQVLRVIQKALADVKTRPRHDLPEHVTLPRLTELVPLKGTESSCRQPVQQAQGLISLQEVTPYPPGVPVLLRGERIEPAHITLLRQWFAAGGRFQAGGEIFSAGICVTTETY